MILQTTDCRSVKFAKLFQGVPRSFWCFCRNFLISSSSYTLASDHTKLVFLGNKNIAPVVYLDNGIPSGVAVDIAHALAGHMAQRLLREARYALIEIEDNGPGMAEEIRRRVFEPFFTTKEPGTGTGLGLSVSYMIVTQNHKGLMEAESTPGKGTCFRVRLPLDKENIDEHNSHY